MQEQRIKPWWVSASIGAAALAVIYGAGALFMRLNAAWYDALIKPVMQPPGFVFAIAFCAVYCAAIASLSLTLIAVRSAKGNARLWALYITCAALNALFVTVFLVLKSATGGMFAILTLVAFSALLLRALFKRKLWLPAWLVLPYAVWLLYLAVINYMLVMLN